MTQGRPDIPAALKREVLVEAGHRCAIPTCRSHPVEIAHIEPWAKVRRHEMINLIALCPNCHTRYDRGEIDRKAMKKYKQNLGLVNSLYSSMERRVLEHFAILRDIKIRLAFPLHVRNVVGNERFEQMIREDFRERAESVFDTIKAVENRPEDVITLPAGNRLMLWQLLRDGYIVSVPGSEVRVQDVPIMEDYRLTDLGKEFLDRWMTADHLNVSEFRCECEIGNSFAHHLAHHVDKNSFDPVARALRVSE